MHDTLWWRRLPFALAMLCAATACASRGAPDFSGRWQPLNRWSPEPTALPLAAGRAYQTTPVDRTLKTLLSRWAIAAGLRLDYTLGADYLLHEAVAGVASDDLADALVRLEAAYVVQGIHLETGGGRIVAARRTGAGAQAATP